MSSLSPCDSEILFILEFFSMKKQRNNEKNKPSRFNNLRAGIPEIISAKELLVRDKIMMESTCSALLTMQDELKFLTSDSRSLVSRFLKIKEDMEDVQEVNKGLLLKYRLGYIQVLKFDFLSLICHLTLQILL